MLSEAGYGAELISRTLAGTDPDNSPLTHLREIPGRDAEFAAWPDWAAAAAIEAFTEAGVERPWRHQVEAADLVAAGHDVAISTGTASGKSLAYQLPVLTAMADDPVATALYLAPTKALGADQLRSVSRLVAGRPAFTHLQPCAYDGDTEPELRQWARAHSRWIFTNPDMLHVGILPNGGAWRGFLRRLRYIVVDECHHYRGVFGSHTALVLHRLLRLAAAAGADPVVIGASATVAEPDRALSRLTGRPAVAVTADTSPHASRSVALWQPPLLEEDPDTQPPSDGAEFRPPRRRSAGAEAARLLADCVIEGARTLCFVRSRRGAELTALRAQQLLAEAAPELIDRIGTYRGGYLADDRRRLEREIADGTLLGVATTNALELGVDISGLDAVIIAGYPGTVASFWQQAGRAGRRGAPSLVVLVARDDPLDTYLAHHPEALLDRPVEATVTDPANPYLLDPHILCAATESPITEADLENWDIADRLEVLTAAGALRRRKAGWYPTVGDDPHGLIDIRGGIGGQVLIVDSTSAQLLGTVDSGRAPSAVHPGAVHLHQGQSFIIDELDLDDGLALAHPEDPDWTTSARSTTEITITATLSEQQYGPVSVAFDEVEVTTEVVGYLRTALTGEVLDTVPLDMPSQELATKAVRYTITPEALAAAGIDATRLPGSLHAAEHCAIGLLGLVAICDRWDIGGLSTDLHPDTGLPTVFVYDGYQGGAGFAERGFHRFSAWLSATREALLSCDCESGCPACVQSPKCGNGNEPLDKPGAAVVLGLLLEAVGGADATPA